jgi:hypothetical protein
MALAAKKQGSRTATVIEPSEARRVDRITPKSTGRRVTLHGHRAMAPPMEVAVPAPPLRLSVAG